MKFIDSAVFAHDPLPKIVILKNFLGLFYQNGNFCSWSLSFYTKYMHTVYDSLTSFFGTRTFVCGRIGITMEKLPWISNSVLNTILLVIFWKGYGLHMWFPNWFIYSWIVKHLINSLYRCIQDPFKHKDGTFCESC